MGSAKKAEKKLKKVKQRLKQLQASHEAVLQAKQALLDNMVEQDRQIEALQEQLNCLGTAHAGGKAEPDQTQERALVGGKRQDWKRFSYLRDRYEHHLNSKSKQMARRAANQDMVFTFGQDSGYTEEELECILS